mmetsp:Transcript_24622/g.36899  ORF Transcript_24622/g.36899 Transcript_24622/m.36899 type:complete len:135 (+) Transcript_24622:94-498(+)|eukprot:CAMPEP_0167760900 /NCGR_PEP_ID=MMETSP0110_2-20121227/11852_1 /TAXON_ID=629695 /ORGANISM="Gymnochlora sp., Strain CCMP2014" /LENGTH=134 /DNA_ID=CAMNT_0007647481 /DNA_START=72 /DNA_END=476 /DNA_ORIENTATION=-
MSSILRALVYGRRFASAFRGKARFLSSESGSIKITFLTAEGKKIEATADDGDSFLDVTVKNEIDEVEGACEGTLACSTCHMIFPQDVYDKLPAMDEEEEDMLDLAIGVTDTSRLGCQVTVKKDMDGLEIQLPSD